MAHIKAYFPTTLDRETIKKDSKILRRIVREDFLSATATQGISAFNLRLFQEPIRSGDIVLTANQLCGQNLVAASTS